MSAGREISKVRVLITHPSTVFIYSILPSAWNFLREIRFDLGVDSKSFNGQAKAFITNGTAFWTLVTLSAKSRAIPIVSSIYMSTFPTSLVGMSTASS